MGRSSKLAAKVGWHHREFEGDFLELSAKPIPAILNSPEIEIL
jgi:inner membrane protein involved in colicin E2 resistance